MHRITRKITENTQDGLLIPSDVAAWWGAYYKPLVHESLTSALVEEENETPTHKV